MYTRVFKHNPKADCTTTLIDRMVSLATADGMFSCQDVRFYIYSSTMTCLKDEGTVRTAPSHPSYSLIMRVHLSLHRIILSHYASAIHYHISSNTCIYLPYLPSYLSINVPDNPFLSIYIYLTFLLCCYCLNRLDGNDCTGGLQQVISSFTSGSDSLMTYYKYVIWLDFRLSP